MTVFALVIAGVAWYAWRTHRANVRGAIQTTHTRSNGLAWKFATRRRFRLGPESWRLSSNGEDGTL